MNREPIILRKLGQDRRVAITQETIIFFPMGHHRGTLVTTYILFDDERGGERRQIKSERRASFFSPHLRERERERERERDSLLVFTAERYNAKIYPGSRSSLTT